MDIALKIFATTLFLSVLAYVYGAWEAKIKMTITERKLKRAGRYPRGSEIHHGMIFKEGERGVIRTEQPSLSWYQKLLGK